MTEVESCPPASSTLETLFRNHLQTVCSRSAEALEATGFAALLVHSGSPLPVFEDDRTYPYEVHAPFKVWAPLDDAPDSFVYFQPGTRPRLLFHQPQDYWYKPPELPSSYWTDCFDIQVITDRDSARRALPADLGRTAYLGDPFPALGDWSLGACNPEALLRRLNYPRAVKTPYELVCLREASRLGALGHAAATCAFHCGASEFEIELAFLRAAGLREQQLPYNPIIAMNSSAAVLHYQLLATASPAQRRSLLIDAGAEFAGYASDITRTHSLDAEFAALIGCMDEMQQGLCAAVHAGVDWRDIHLCAHQWTAELLREADITTCSAEEAVATGVSGVFLPHGIGHLLGLEVHDVGGLMSAAQGGEIPRPPGHPYLRLTRVLQEGFVVTMEPGIYFIDSLLNAARADARGARINWARVDTLRPFGGIRIEDDLAVTAEGCENLTRNAFSTLSA